MELKQERLSLRLSSEEKKFIRKRAIDKDMKISEYIMDLVERDFQNSKHGNNLNIEYGRVKSSIKCINDILDILKDGNSPVNINIPLVLPAVNELMQELKELEEGLKGKNLID